MRRQPLPREISALGGGFVLAPLLQDSGRSLSDSELDALVNARKDPDVIGHNLLSVVTVDERGSQISTTSSSSSTASSNSTANSTPTPSGAAGDSVATTLTDGVEYLYSWAAFLASLWRSDDPEATFEPSTCTVSTADLLTYMRRVNKSYNAYNHAILRQKERHGKGIDEAAERAALRAASILSPKHKAIPHKSTNVVGAEAQASSMDMEELVMLTRPKARDLLEAERHLELTLATVPRMFFTPRFDFRNPETS